MSHGTCHVSRVECNFFVKTNTKKYMKLDKGVELVGGGSAINGATRPVSQHALDQQGLLTTVA